CINAGVPGYSLFQGWRYLEAEGLGYEPDLVVLNFGWNDYSAWDNRSDQAHYETARAARPPGLLAASRACRLLWGILHAPPKVNSADRPRVLPEEFRALLGKVKALTDERGIELLVLVWPMRGNTEAATPADMRTELQQEMIAFGDALDLVPLARQLVAEHGSDAIYLDNGHVSASAHAAIAQAIVDRIEGDFQ
ncbi:MAG: lysophospholipase L1-like esterase, partial [Rhodothermales bacterium]